MVDSEGNNAQNSCSCGEHHGEGIVEAARNQQKVIFLVVQLLREGVKKRLFRGNVPYQEGGGVKNFFNFFRQNVKNIQHAAMKKTFLLKNFFVLSPL